MKYNPTEELLALDESERIRWAVELESGEYEQARGNLFDGTGYCCLGVWEWCNGHEESDLFDKEFPNDLIAPTKIGDLFPHQIKAATCEKWDRYDFDDLNDTLYFTFPEIAQILRGNEVVK